MKYIIGIVVFILIFLGGMYFMYQWKNSPDSKITEKSEVILQRLKNVNKIITKEGYFTELYDYKDYTTFNLPWFRKKALVRVKAKASVGYDLEKLEFDLDESTKEIVIKNIPPLELLSLEHDLDYYDITQGSFNSFEAEDYNKINSNAKNFVKSQVLSSELMKESSFTENLFFQQLKLIADAGGWRIKAKQNAKQSSTVPKDSLIKN